MPDRAADYRPLFDSALLGLYVATPDGRLASCNKAFLRIFGFASIDEALKTPVAALYASSSPEGRQARIEGLRSDERIEQVHATLRRLDGEPVYVVGGVVAVRDETGAVKELQGYILDVTESEQAQAELREREQHFRAVFADAADPILILDNARRIVDANHAATTLFGLESGELQGRSLDGLLAGDPGALVAAWRELLAFGEARREHHVTSRDQGARTVECSYRASIWEGRHLCIARDVTERRQLEERLAQAERIESVGRLAGGIAHDFNNLLTAILGYAELMLTTRRGDDPDRGDLEEILKAGRRAASLTQQLLAYGRKQVLLPTKVDLNAIVTDLKTMLRRVVREDIALTLDLAPEPACVQIDTTQIEQVILNLVLNARDALAGGGSIRLEVANVELKDSEVPAEHRAQGPRYVRLRVIDDGVGITPEVRAHLFEPFFTTKEVGKGTGLGLASVYGIVRQSLGFISVESEPGRGAAFVMHFPAMPGPAAAIAPPADQRRLPKGDETILLVEDEPAVRTIVSTVLRRQGYRVIEAATAEAGLELFAQHRDAVDLLISDVVMPGMSGPALAQRLVAARPGLRVLFMSGHTESSLAISPTNAGMGFIAKPFKPSVLAARVHEMLAQPRPALVESVA